MKRNLLRSLLFVAAILLGVNASAQITELPFSADFESSIAPFDAGDIVDATDWGKALRVSNTTATATFDESISALTENDEVTIQFNALHGWEGSNKTTKIALLNTDGDELISYTYDITKCQVVDVAFGGATVNGFAAFMGQANFNNNKSANGFTHSQHYVTTEGYTPVVKFVVSGSGLVSFNYAYTPAKQAALNKNFAATISGKKIDLGKIVITDNQTNNDRSFGMDNLSITKETKVTYPYTINYVDENEQTIKTAEGRAEVGDKVAIDTESFWVESKKYVYVSDDSDSKLISAEGTNVITVKVSEAPKYTYSVKDNINNILAEGTAYEGEDVVYYVPYFVYKESVFYKSPVLSTGSLSYGQSTISAISADTEITVTYTEEDGTNVVFYAEAENLNGITLVDDQYTKIRMSNGKAGYFAEKTAIETLPKGKYTITAATRSGATKFYAGNTEVHELTSTGSVTETTSDEFAIGKDTEISTSIGSASAYFDYIIIRKTGEVTEAEAELLNAKAELLEEITAAKAIDTTDKEGAEALATAITDAETALNAEGASTESLAEAKTTLAAALKVFRLANPSGLMTEAKALAADEDAVAVGKLIDAIAAAEESGDETALAAAVEQFKRDNAESSIDYTAKVGTDMGKWTGAGGTVASVTTKTGANIPLVELYASSGAGIKMSQKITGLENGLYRVKVFATSHNARGEDGAALNTTAEDVAYVFATSGEVTNKTWITARGVSDWFVDGELTNPYTIEDIEVSNGELTIGLALDKEKQTGWHSIQIYSLECINPAKTAWGIVKAALQKSIDAATDTLKTGENGKADLEAAIEVAKVAVASNKLNVEEVVAANNALEAAIHEFFEANLQFRGDVVYYIQEKQTGKFLSRGAAWGTRAVVDDYGVPVQLTYVADNKFAIKGVDNNSTYGDDAALFSDGNGDRMRSFIFTETTDGYKLTNTNNNLFVAVNYTGEDSLGVIANSETASIFNIISVADYNAIVAANKKAINEAAITNAGYKLDDPLAYTEKIDTLTFKTGSAWPFTAERDKSNAVTNENGTEVFQGTGKFTQNIENLAAGLYKVTVQAMYRDGANTSVAALYDKGYNLSHAYLDANGSRVQVKSWGEDRLTDGNPNSMGEFAALANEGKYVSEGLAVVGEDGKLNLTVAVPSFISSGWFIASQVTYQKVSVDSVAIYRAELQTAITKAEGANTANKTEESINALNNAIKAAKELAGKEEATIEELKAGKKAIEDAVAGLQFKALELTDNTIYGWNAGMEGGGKAVASDEQSVTYPTAGYTTIRLNGAKDFTTNVVTITLDNAVSAGDTIKVTAFRNKNAADKKSGFKAKFEIGEKIVSTTTGFEFVNIDSSEASAADSNRGTEPNTCEFIVPEEAAGSKVITLTRAETGTNLFITELYIEQKQFEKKAFEGFVAISAASVQNPSSPMAPTSTAEQTVKIAQTAEKGKVNITFSGFQLAPIPFTTGEFTLAATATDNADGSISYTSEPQPVSIIMGQMAASYTATIEGTQASADATPKLTLQLKQASIFTVVFAATETEAKDGIEVATGIQNVKTAADNKTIYNLNGQKVNKAQKGLFIINGKKVVIK